MSHPSRARLMRVRKSLGALEEPQFRLLFLAQAATALGDRMAPLALAFGVLAITPSASALGLVLACGAASTVACLLVGGVFADRMPRRNVMVAADFARAGSQGIVAALLLTGHAEVWHLAVGQVVNGAAMAFFTPAQQGIVPEVVSAARLQQANALLGMSRSFTGIGGPGIAGALVATVGAGAAIAVDAATFLVSGFLLARVALAPVSRATKSFLADLREGWGEFASRTWVWASVANFALFQMIALASWFVLGPYVAKTDLDGAKSWAVIQVASSVGALAGGFIALRYRPRRVGIVMFVMVATYGPQLALLGIPAPTVVIALGAAGAAAAMSVFAALWFTALQEHIPEHARSRVSSYDWVGSMIFLPVGMAVVGPASDSVGVGTVLLFAAGWATFASLAMIALPSIRGLESTGTDAGPARTWRGRDWLWRRRFGLTSGRDLPPAGG